MAKVIGMGGNKPQTASEQTTQQQPKIDLGKSKPIVCAECGYDTFVDGSKFRKISKLITGTPQDVVIPMEVFLCGNCGEPVEELMPDQMKALLQMDKNKAAENNG
jgi:DNA-directed RNA polymerase subunit RPC12/RpoP